MNIRGRRSPREGTHASPPQATTPTARSNSTQPGTTPGPWLLVISWVRLVVHSVAAAAAEGKRWLGVITHPRTRWRLWDWGPGAVTWVFCAEPLVIAWIATETIQARVGWVDLARFTLFLACGLAHAYGTRESEERRRGAHGNGTHVDQTSIWFFSAALFLPVPLVLVLIAVIRIQRWLIARKPFHKWLHTNLAIAMSALAVHAVADATPLRDWLTGARPLPSSTGEMVVAAASMGAAICAYFLAQAVMVGAVRALAHAFPYGGGEPATDESLLVDALGTWRDNIEILFALALAAAAAVFAALSMPLLLVMVPLAIYTTRVEQRLGQLATANRQLEIDATHDPLTGLPNRRGFENSAKAILAQSRRKQHTTAVLLLDLDHFKRINDTMGHLVGDEVLAAFAGAVRAATRDSDVLCRWGGEEVAVLCPETGHDEAMVLAERIRATVAAMRIPVSRKAGGDTVILGGTEQCDPPGCTVSIGVAIAPEHGTELEELAEAADQALYLAKHGGRDQVHPAVTAARSSTPTARVP